MHTIVAIIASARLLGGITQPSIFLLAFFLFLALCMSLRFKSTFSMLFVLFFCYIPVNIIISDPDPVFSPWMRFFSFSIVLLAVSPMLNNSFILRFRKRLFHKLLWMFSILSILSFFCYFIGINLMVVDNYIGVGGTFSGLFNQSMVLGPISGVSFLFLYDRYRDNHMIVWLLCCILCAGALLFSASRSAFLATIIAFIFYLYLSSVSKMRFVKRLLYIAIVLFSTYSLWSSALNGFVYKNEVRTSSGQFGSRTDKFTYRIGEFKENPIFGVGFASIDPFRGDSFDTDNGVVEPGSSWLSVLSMIGLIGAFFVTCILFFGCKNLMSVDNDTSGKSLVSSLFVLMVVFMIFEGFIFASGNTLCLFFWLLLGVMYDFKYLETE